MTASGRSSGRVDEPKANCLDRGPEPTDSDAECRDQLAHHHAHRPGPARISRQHLTQLRSSLSDRHLAVLRALDLLKFASGKNLERLIYPSSRDGLTPLSATRTCRRELAHLYDLKLLERLDRRVGGVRAGSASFVYRLTPAGYRLLGGQVQRRARQPGLAHLQHVLAVGELVVEIHEAVREHGHEVVELQTEPACWRPIIGAGGGRQVLKPDLHLVLAIADAELHWFVEIDRATEHRPVLARKCQIYLSAWQQGREQAEYGVFPRVLWVVPDDDRAREVGEVIARLPSVPDGMFLVCTTSQAVAILTGTGGPV